MFLTEIQLAKMENDIVAFFFTAKKLETEINNVHLPALRKQNYMFNTVECAAVLSYSTAMQVNFGLSIELTLKRIAYMSGHAKCIGTHDLIKIYNLLKDDIKNELKADFADWLTRNTLKTWIRDTNYTKPLNIKTFCELLQFLDKHDLYGDRYSFEEFSIEPIQTVITPSFFETFFNTLNHKHWGK